MLKLAATCLLDYLCLLPPLLIGMDRTVRVRGHGGTIAYDVARDASLVGREAERVTVNGQGACRFVWPFGRLDQ